MNHIHAVYDLRAGEYHNPNVRHRKQHARSMQAKVKHEDREAKEDLAALRAIYSDDEILSWAYARAREMGLRYYARLTGGNSCGS
jgi:hypothetical protein